MPTLESLKEQSKKFLSTLLHNVLATAILAIIGVPVLVSWVTGTLDTLFQTIQSPMPIWAAIALVLLSAVYVQIKSKQNPEPSEPPKSKNKERFVDIGRYRWKVIIFSSFGFDIDRYPYCQTHNVKFIQGTNRKYCPGDGNEQCRNAIGKSEEFHLYESAKSIVENKIRSGELK